MIGYSQQKLISLKSLKKKKKLVQKYLDPGRKLKNGIKSRTDNFLIRLEYVLHLLFSSERTTNGCCDVKGCGGLIVKWSDLRCRQWLQRGNDVALF